MSASAPEPPAGAARRLRVVIADDEALARDSIRLCLQDQGDADVVAECANGHEAVEAIRRHAPDLVFLDVQMPGFDGFRVIEAVGLEAMPAVVFVTAFDQHALRAFDVHAVDYVLKPFDNARFRAAVDRARRMVRSREGEDLQRRLAALLAEFRGGAGPGDARPPGAYATRLTVREDERIFILPVDEVDWFEADDGQVRVHAGKRSFLMRTTLTALLMQVDPTRFTRIHRSMVVAVARVREVQPWFGGDYVAILHDGRQLRVSRTFRDLLLKPTH